MSGIQIVNTGPVCYSDPLCLHSCPKNIVSCVVSFNLLLVCLSAYRCPAAKCKSKFFTKKAVDKHVAMRHKKVVQNGTGVMCDTCGKLLRNQVQLKTREQ